MARQPQPGMGIKASPKQGLQPEPESAGHGQDAYALIPVEILPHIFRKLFEIKGLPRLTEDEGTDGLNTGGPVRVHRGDGAETVGLECAIDNLANGLPVLFHIHDLLLMVSYPVKGLGFTNIRKDSGSRPVPPSAQTDAAAHNGSCEGR